MEKLYNEENVKRKEAEERERRLRDELEKCADKLEGRLIPLIVVKAIVDSLGCEIAHLHMVWLIAFNTVLHCLYQNVVNDLFSLFVVLSLEEKIGFEQKVR